MKTSIQISIKKPCNQNFEAFTKTDRGGYCQSCKKEVLDLTQMTDKELIHYFSTAVGKPCAKLKKSQLKTYYHLNTGKMNKFLPKTAGLASFSLLTLCTVIPSSAQDMVALETPKEQTVTRVATKLTPIVQEKEYTVKGLVTDEANLPLPGVNVVLKGSTTGIQTDFEGVFEFPQKLKAGDVLIFSYIGYDTKTYKVKAGDSSIKEVNIQFSGSDITLLGAVTVDGVHRTKRSFFQKIGDLFR